jgi:hypothetical protein
VKRHVEARKELEAARTSGDAEARKRAEDALSELPKRR